MYCIVLLVCKKVVELWVEVGLIKSIPYHLFSKFIFVSNLT
jgi:hypothetical protein